MSPTTIFAPASTPAAAIVGLATLVIGVTALIFVCGYALLTYAIFRFRKRRDDDGSEPAQFYGSNQVEVAWTVIPILIVVVLFLASARVITNIQNADRPADAIQVVAVGHQFWWEFRYPALGVVTANELHVPVSDPARPTPTFITLLSADTDHSFWIPRLGGKTDLIPNRVNSTWIDPYETGLYLGQCAQYCGTQHAKMLLRVYVDSREAFDRWVQQQREPARAEPGHRGPACVSEHGVYQLSRRVGDGRNRPIRSGSDPCDEPRHDRLRNRSQHRREPAGVDSKPGSAQAGLANAVDAVDRAGTRFGRGVSRDPSVR